MKFIDLFAGIGGFRYGLEASNGRDTKKHSKVQKPKPSPNGGNGQRRRTRTFTCVYSNEWDKYASQIYKKHYGECDTTDITKVKAKDIPDHDLLCAGFPCQSFSIAGKRKGFEDTRGTLFFDIARIASHKRPRYLLLENVKGLLSHDKGKTFSTILGVLSDLGYRVEWQVLNSKHFGVPQNRERVFIVGHLGGKRRRKVFPIGGQGNKVVESGEVAGTLQADYFKGDRTGGYVVKEKKVKVKGMLSSKKWDRFNESSRRVYDTKGISPTVPTSAGGGHLPKIEDVEKWLAQDNLELTEKGRKSLTPRIRRLTPTECERLQGFPDGWTEGISDTQRYKCLGNAVTTNVVTAIGYKLL